MQPRKPKNARAGAALPVLPLSDQVAVSAALDKALDGSALWVLLAVYRTFASLDRDQADEVGAMGLSPLQFNILTTLQRTRQPTTMGALAGMLVVKPNNLSGNINTLAEEEATELPANAVGHVTLAFEEPLLTLPFEQSRILGALILVDTASHKTSGAVLVN